MQAVDAGRLSLTDRVADRLAAWRGLDREAVTIADLLEHASGLTAYLPLLPLALRGDGALPLDLDATYTETRQRCRL